MSKQMLALCALSAAWAVYRELDGYLDSAGVTRRIAVSPVAARLGQHYYQTQHYPECRFDEPMPTKAIYRRNE